MKFLKKFQAKKSDIFSLRGLSFSCCRWMFIEVLNSKKTPLPWKIPGYALVYWRDYFVKSPFNQDLKNV